MKSTDLLVLNHLFIFIVVVQPMQLRLKPFIVEQGGLVEFADKVLICLCLCMLKKNKMLASAPSDHNRFVTLRAPVLIPLVFILCFYLRLTKPMTVPRMQTSGRMDFSHVVSCVTCVWRDRSLLR